MSQTEVLQPRSLDEWATVIRGDLAGAVEGLVAAGRHLLDAKAEHPGTFVAWVESGAVGIGISTAERFIKVADALQRQDSSALTSLPPDRTALYELARLEPPQLTAAIEAGEVTPGMGRKDAMALVARYRTGSERSRGHSVVITLLALAGRPG